MNYVVCLVTYVVSRWDRVPADLELVKNTFQDVLVPAVDFAANYVTFTVANALRVLFGGVSAEKKLHPLPPRIQLVKKDEVKNED